MWDTFSPKNAGEKKERDPSPTWQKVKETCIQVPNISLLWTNIYKYIIVIFFLNSCRFDPGSNLFFEHLGCTSPQQLKILSPLPMKPQNLHFSWFQMFQGLKVNFRKKPPKPRICSPSPILPIHAATGRKLTLYSIYAIVWSLSTAWKKHQTITSIKILSPNLRIFPDSLNTWFVASFLQPKK